IPTITGLWEGAMFHEREMYDMMGIVFDGNRDLRRIYMSSHYSNFPQRKDFILPDDAADSPAAGVNPLERPETWDLARFREELTSEGHAPIPPRMPRPASRTRSSWIGWRRSGWPRRSAALARLPLGS